MKVQKVTSVWLIGLQSMPGHFEMDLGGNQVAVASYIVCYSMLFLLVSLIKAVGSFFTNFKNVTTNDVCLNSIAETHLSICIDLLSYSSQLHFRLLFLEGQVNSLEGLLCEKLS